MQDPEDNLELERRVDRALKGLPYPSAPALFSARVMSRIEINPAPAVVPASLEWPMFLKIALTGMSFFIVVGALLLWPFAVELARSSWNSPAVAWVGGVLSTARPMVPIVLVYVAAMCAVSAAAVSMLKHVALGGATNS